MSCYISCTLAIAFLVASLFVMFNTEKNPIMKEYIKGLNVQQKIKYIEITKERRNLYLCGFTLGFIIALILLYFFNKKLNRWGSICMVAAVTFTFSYFYYILMPKKDYMLHYLKDKEDIENWWKVYRVMQYHYHLGFVLGLLAVIFFCNYLVSK